MSSRTVDPSIPTTRYSDTQPQYLVPMISISTSYSRVSYLLQALGVSTLVSIRSDTSLPSW